MSTQEIPKAEWSLFFEDFTRRHQGWMVTVEEIGAEFGAQEEANAIPLVGIAADVKDHESRLTLMLGGRPELNVNRIIENPTRVWSRQGEDEESDAIEIEAGAKLILRFNSVPRHSSQPA
ncbi:MAG: hypothetical protein JWL90_1467 [Chthoniobacteraceae bacterium]|nr:hypothetical protein [Chthoniobacteraceae bacterium]